METTAEDPLKRWWWRCKALFLAGMALAAVQLAVLGVRPGIDVPLQSWPLAIARIFDVAFMILRIGLVVCWIGVLLNSGGLPVSARRGQFVFTAWYLALTLQLSLPSETPTLLYVAIALVPITLLVLMLWYLAKSVGEATQKEIDTKLAHKSPMPCEVADIAPAAGEAGA
ncbi:MAG: hypothetical protein P4L85_24900 [Paludisphaera borealis]|uniref:hypothetical protein n=1 Tax=Paludisphaera borealis TaxID=1387353 RepID=UPI002845229C|nr:hypothetical protein [Paludisphaera borealis]MDR3622614.1 hypothetical protein [Paludisphaera borealis]